MRTPRTAITLSGPATMERLALLLEAVSEVCDAAGVDQATRHDLRLAVEEVCVNVMRHAYRGGEPGDITLDVELAAWEGRPAIQVGVRDRGQPFDPLRLASPPQGLDARDQPLGGLGVHLMRQVTDVQAYHYDTATGNHLTLVKFLATQQGEDA